MMLALMLAELWLAGITRFSSLTPVLNAMQRAIE
jgi:hypothetical protein